jgi:hypothetical protein
MIETIIVVVGAIPATIIAAFVWERKIRDRVFVRRIVSTDDEDVEELIELYSKLFPDETTNYSGEHIVEILEKGSEPENTRHVRSEDIVLVARFKQEVVGFMFCHFYPARRKAIVSYYGIDGQFLEARKSAADCLLKKLKSLLTAKSRKCEYLFFDVERPDTRLELKKNRERKCRIILFKQSARHLREKAYEIQFDYQSPKITLDEKTHKTSLVLMFVPLKPTSISSLEREELTKFLEFVLLDCYGDIYRMDDPRFKKYHEHLNQLLKKYQRDLPARILLA